MTDITTPQLIHSLRSELCPACGAKKKRRQTLCWPCYRALPKPLKDALWAGVGNGYEQAVEDALAFHQVTAPHWEKSP